MPDKSKYLDINELRKQEEWNESVKPKLSPRTKLAMKMQGITFKEVTIMKTSPY